MSAFFSENWVTLAAMAGTVLVNIGALIGWAWRAHRQVRKELSEYETKQAVNLVQLETRRIEQATAMTDALNNRLMTEIDRMQSRHDQVTAAYGGMRVRLQEQLDECHAECEVMRQELRTATRKFQQQESKLLQRIEMLERGFLNDSGDSDLTRGEDYE